MKSPAFQFYPKDWRTNVRLRRCSPAARGAWMDVLCLLHMSEEYGVVRFPLAEVAEAAGVPLKLLKELMDKGVLKGGDKGCEPYIFTPRHAGQDGESVELIAATTDPIWFSSRFVRDEWVRQRRGRNTRFGDDNPPPKAATKANIKEKPKAPPKPPIGDVSGDGLAAATASATATTAVAVVSAPDGEQSPSLVLRDNNHTEFVRAVLVEYTEVWCAAPAQTLHLMQLVIKFSSVEPKACKVSWWRWYFEVCLTDDFLAGRKNPSFRADLLYLLREEVFGRMVEAGRRTAL